MSAREASTLDSEKNDGTPLDGGLDDERELARMGYKQELKCVHGRPHRLRCATLTSGGGGGRRDLTLMQACVWLWGPFFYAHAHELEANIVVTSEFRCVLLNHQRHHGHSLPVPLWLGACGRIWTQGASQC